MNYIERKVSVGILASVLMCCSLSSIADESLAEENQIAPNFEIMQTDGTLFKLSEFRGKQPVYLIFWNTWCHFCMKKIPKLKHAQSKLLDQIKIIAVNTGLKDSLDKTLAFQKQFDINYPLAFDHNKKVTDLYGVWGTPTEFIIDINGIIQHRDGIPAQLEPHLAEWNQVLAVNQTANLAHCNPDLAKKGATTC